MGNVSSKLWKFLKTKNERQIRLNLKERIMYQRTGDETT